MAELKPCPFCGGEAEFEEQVDENGVAWEYAVCQQCFAQTDGCESEEHAAICWNMRWAKTPCDLCKFAPPSSMDGKPCTMCVAEGRADDGN